MNSTKMNLQRQRVIPTSRVQSYEESPLQYSSNQQERIVQECKTLLEFIRDRKLATPALVLLELYRPMVGLGDAIIIFAQPFLKIFSIQHNILEILRSRSNLDCLIVELTKIEVEAQKVGSGL